MSFWTVPESDLRPIPRRFAVATYIARRMIAVALMVIDVETRSSGMSVEQGRHVLERIDRHADPADLAGRKRMVRVVADLRRQVEGDAQPHDACDEQIAIAAIRLGGRSEAGVLAHRPGPAAVHVRLDAAREGKGTRQAESACGSIPTRSFGVR